MPLASEPTKDVSSRADISHVVKVFYDYLLADDLLKPIFIPLNLETHLPVVVNFWENMLFQTGNYSGGMLWVHLKQNEKTPLTTDSFERWLALFFRSIDQNYQGKNADFMKHKAYEIGQIMLVKMQIANQQ